MNPLGTGGGGLVDEAEVTLAGATEIVDNAAPGASGGGLSVDESVVIGGVVARNEAFYQGGGVIVLSSTLQGVVVEDNTAREDAGLCVGVDVAVEGGRIAGNVAELEGGGLGPIGGPGASVVLDGVEVADNRAPRGAGMLVRELAATVRGSAVVRNVAETAGGGAALDYDGTLASDGSDWGAGADDNLPGDVFAGTELTGWGADASFSCDPAGC